ncbi:TonB-dependent receptor [Mariniphaga sediminis]|nr:TonB-dependent receptor [Mariniphaga sediminis]
MRITVFLVLVSILQTFANDAYSQKTRLSLDFPGTKLVDVLDEIENKTEFYFLFNEKLIDTDRKINMSVKNEKIGEILDQLFASTDVVYTITDRKIILAPSFLSENEQQQNPITGTVTDEAGQPLPGVTVVVKGTTQGTVTNADGNYSLSNIPDDVTLVFSFVGMRTQEVVVGNQTSINIIMEEETIGMEEVVVVGYGTQKKINLTGSVDVVAGEKLENRPNQNVGELLKGTSPNLNIVMSERGGEPGAEPKWNIRGMGSISGNDSPLILVDGVEMDINNLDPQNIESVSVLKDASASAIYGARAPFGVVLITTKRGKKDGRMSVKYSNNLSFDTKLGIPDMENSLVYATAYNQAYANAGQPPMFSDEHIERIKGYLDGTYQSEYNPDDPTNSIWSGRRQGNANNNWPDIMLKDFKFDQKHTLDLSGGDEKTQYYASIGYYDEGSFYAYGYDDYQRYNALANITSEVTDWLKVSFNTKYAKSPSDYPEGITSVERMYTFRALYQFGPNTPMYNINGSLYQPILRNLEDAGRIVTENDDFWLALKTDLEPVRGWVTSVSYDYNLSGREVNSNPKPVWVELGNGRFGNVGKPSDSYEAIFSRSPYTLFNTITSFEKTIKNHYFKVLVGYEQEEKIYSSLNGRGESLITEEVPSISTTLGATSVDDTKWDWSTQGVFGRLNYNYKEKYLLEFSARYNGSSRFAPEDRWGFFPSVSAGYNISKENFWETIGSVVNRLKIRGSYGALGNQNVASYLYISSIPVYNELQWILGGERPVYALAPALTSDGLTWEKITTMDFGLDAGFFNDRLDFVFDWFERITTDMFGPQPTLPYTLGASAPQANNASLSTKGFEITLSWEDRISSDFSYNVRISLGDNKTTILKYRNDNGFIDNWYEGKEVGEIWGFISDGLIQTEGEEMPDQSELYSKWGPGDIKYKDLSGDGKISTGTRTLGDHGDLIVIGNSTPRYNIGINAGFNWENFDFSMFWQGIGKRDYFPRSSVYGAANAHFWGLVRVWASSEVLKGSPVLDYWRPADETNMFGPNTDAYFPKPYFSNENNKNVQVQSRYLLNAAYLRLKNIQVGYTVPRHLSNKVYVQNARIYISGENLISLTSLPKSLDPETSISSELSEGGYFRGASSLVYPIARSFSIGLNLTF